MPTYRSAPTIKDVFKRALQEPRTTLVILIIGCMIAIGSALVGTKGFEEGWSASPWLAWPSGMLPFLVPGFVAWLLLLVPPGPLENPWTRRIGTTLIVAVVLGSVLQLLDDHVMGHAGTDNPLGFSIPFQDWLTAVPLTMLGVAFVGTLLVTVYRLARYLRRKSS